MAASTLVDAGYLVALLIGRDRHHAWAVSTASRHPPPWHACEAVLSETFHLLGPANFQLMSELLRRGSVVSSFNFAQEHLAILALMAKYSQVPMSLADACLVRMSETLPDPIVLSTDGDFRVYRRHSRQAIPHLLPS
ncbi:MAG: type II toxin-antitoxin system VapC family toxin [Rhizomicrobium sp.]